MAVYDEGFAPSDGAGRASVFANYAGAALSLAMIIGVAFWGYKLIMRDVSGIPVVRAMEGEMRVLPDNPGGAVALHTGLAVNEVAAVGEAGGPEDRLVLAPRTAGLAQEDLEAQPQAEVAEIVPASLSTDIAAPAQPVAESSEETTTDDVLAIVEQIAAEVAEAEAVPAVAVIPASVPGVSVSLRPLIRPTSLQVTTAPAAPAGATNNSEVAVTTTSFAAGTNLVQLGAFTSPSLAAQEWNRLEGRFAELMTGHDRVIQVSNQSSNTWYRLRASGFADRAEARRFCAALSAEGAECIAVVVD
ncbi:SPOR domain-containing protein [Cognatiyoonia sp. IB215182]|uniref:SPOR domain-containing protein n=1 Tax=Cognatiyoonia sp. IB215182 TaxID=3097353 RepID=UPI002A1392AB|nr:SPOR domain-containing protein [Cognatiyoonia sp. IB215182]MDX8352144.1 SPOR domain-containing protein [Cognatiyoonia sp. IB215182]